jgi:intracellular sulfur oxidation DsrE/DsrF family protein
MSKSIAIVISQNGVEGESGKPLHTLLDMLRGVQDPPVQLLFHTGAVSLVTETSPILDELRDLEAHGVSMIACSTCLSYMGLRDQVAVGKIGGISSLNRAMESADMVITL